jgi:hypothetical protein
VTTTAASTLWAVDVPELDRAVDVRVHGDRSPSHLEVLAFTVVDQIGGRR